ncbi:hypothetical protein HK413_08225 [Mucilaginibacter sp. S1162]|uniref:Porin n=1 Tax=Mucilaginibacter humi TaxID=2732510 RepID=A0ABX1W1N1_9SPHI|nr:hypothetical protein [Mucilaginibacter humi]NNU34136.1 hypothetical protein [Mucilaginibacter humi]
MGNRKYILVFLLVAVAYRGNAQSVNTFDQADSVSNAQYLAGNWQQLLATGKVAIGAGFDSPALRQRLGYARLITGDYSGALKDYDVIFKNDSYNTVARYYAYLCHKYLNQELSASYNAAYLDTDQLKTEKTSSYGLINTGIESSLKVNDNTYRGTSSYTRVYLTNRLSWRWQLEQSVAYFNQYITGSTVQIPGAPLLATISSNDQQLEYYGKVSYSLTENLQLMAAYHYLNTNYQTVTYTGNMGLFGIKYSGVRFTLQGDVNMGSLISKHINQYNVSLMLYPAGNLNFYTISRGSYIDQNNTGTDVFSQIIGYKLLKNTRAETSGTFGDMNNYNDADGLYIYNAIDPTKLRLGETIFQPIGKHLQLQLNYTYEQKHDDTHSLNYNQHSITAGLLWKF